MSTANTIVTQDLVVDHHTAHGTIRALAHGGMRIAGGSSVAIMGPSGCGKSTLLGILAGLAGPTTGTVTIGDVVLSALTERERGRFRRSHVGMVYQVDNLLPHLTVEENIGLQLAICRRDRNRGKSEDPTTLLDRLGLGSLAERLPDELSGGQRQRVAVARAVVHRPALILADEPTGALDDDNAAAVIELLVELHQEIGSTLVVVTHDPEIARHTARTLHLRSPETAQETTDVG